MAGFIEERTSNSALWCQRIAFFLIPYFLMLVLLYRAGQLDVDQLFVLLGGGFLLALTSLILAFRATVELWEKGYRGGSKMIRGLIVTIILLIPFGYYAFLALQLPLINDVSTDALDPPDFASAIEIRKTTTNGTANQIVDYDSDHVIQILTAYPALQPRRYPAGAERVLEAARYVVKENEWPITGEMGAQEPQEVGEESQLADNNSVNDQATAADSIERPENIFLEFIQRTPVFGFENDVVVRIVTEEQSTLVDVRSASRWGRHDFGANAQAIQTFLNLLDEQLLGIAGEG